MRIALTLTLLFVVTVSSFADNPRRGRWRVAPLRAWKAFDGYQVRTPGWDTSYYTPYTPYNTTNSGTPTPVTGTWQSETGIPNAIPNTTWTDGTPTQTTTPSTTTTPTTTQRYRTIPNVTSDPVPSTINQRPTGTNTTRTINGRTTNSAGFQYQTPQSDYWNTLNGSNK